MKENVIFYRLYCGDFRLSNFIVRFLCGLLDIVVILINIERS